MVRATTPKSGVSVALSMKVRGGRRRLAIGGPGDRFKGGGGTGCNLNSSKAGDAENCAVGGCGNQAAAADDGGEA
jgi:hypothetical protein